jgi:hypothetical protein
MINRQTVSYAQHASEQLYKGLLFYVLQGDMTRLQHAAAMSVCAPMSTASTTVAPSAAATSCTCVSGTPQAQICCIVGHVAMLPVMPLRLHRHMLARLLSCIAKSHLCRRPGPPGLERRSGPVACTNSILHELHTVDTRSAVYSPQTHCNDPVRSSARCQQRAQQQKENEHLS